MFFGNQTQGLLQFYDGKMGFLSAIDREARVLIRNRAFGRHPASPPQIADENVSQNYEQPGAKIGSWLPAVQARDRAHQTLLHQIVGLLDITREVAGVAAKPGDLLLDRSQPRIRHGLDASFLSRRPAQLEPDGRSGSLAAPARGNTTFLPFRDSTGLAHLLPLR